MQLIVLGMHRSGTSGVTRLLNMAGAWFGPEGIATDANEENPKGFWERRDVRAVCDGLLQDSGFDWWKVSGFAADAVPDDVREQGLAEFDKVLQGLDAHRPWVLKEPRLCLVFPVLRPSLEIPICIHVTREPLEIARSVHVRNGFPLQAGLALWELYTIRALDASAGLPRLLVRFEDLMADPVATVTRLVTELTELGVHGLQVPTDREITAFISPDLHRQHVGADQRPQHLNTPQMELASAIDEGRLLDLECPLAVSEGALEVLRMFEDDQARRERVDELEAALGEQKAEALALESRLAEVDASLRHAGKALATVVQETRALGRSRSWLLAWKAMSLRQRVTPGMAKQERAPLERLAARVETVRRELGTPAPADDVPPAAARAPEPTTPVVVVSGTARPRSSRPKIAVLAWDIGHNPLGRAHILADLLSRRFDVEIWGAQFERYGSRPWAPLREGTIPLRTFDGHEFPSHLGAMTAVAAQIDADAIWVSKPRLPSFALGVLAKEIRNRPLVLDVDDHELAFFGEDTGLSAEDILRSRSDRDLSLPFERAWTRFSDGFIGATDALTVSNTALQERYGGLIVPHARDERVFDPDRYDRAETRRRLGVADTDRLLLFGGTPRIHKGILTVLQALDQLGDERYRVALFGTRELEDIRAEIGPLERWLLPLPYQPFDELARLVGAADLACVLQDPAHPVSRYQMPAKVSDALAMAVPCLVSDVPPLRPLIEAGVVHVHDGSLPLAERISRIFDDGDDAADRARHGRKLFLESCSYAAVSELVAPVFEKLLEEPPPLEPALRGLVDVPRRLFSGPDGSPPSSATNLPARVPGRRRRSIAPGELYDLVIFWKQNDTGLYGRRQDMMLKYLARSGRFGTIVHFDNPITPEALVKTYRGSTGPSDQSRPVVRQTLARLAGRRHEAQVHHHTFLHAGTRSARLRLPSRAEYPDHVASVLRRYGVGGRPTIFWVYPNNPDFPLIADTLDPDLVVADVVDDNRTWYTPDSPHHDRLDRNYEAILSRSDLVLANCAPVAESMQRFAPEVHVVPNGCELPDGSPLPPRPKELAGLEGPIIGYVGNLSSRIDLELLDAIVRARPLWNFVFVGSAHLDQSILELEAQPNVHFLGVKPYGETQRLVRHFDVGLIPHLDNEMTRSMNPLKAFVYAAAGVPVVSTPIANISELGSLIRVAQGHDGFLRAIDEALEQGRQEPDLDILGPHAWEVRVDQVLDLIDAAMGAPSQP